MSKVPTNSSVASELGLLTSLHYLLESKQKNIEHGFNYHGYIALIASQKEVLMYSRRVRGYSNKNHKIDSLPPITYDQFCREELARRFITHGDISPAFDNLLQLYSLLEQMTDIEWDEFDRHCQEIATERGDINANLFGLKDILSMLVTSSSVYLLTDDWMYAIAGLIFSGLSYTHLDHFGKMGLSLCLSLFSSDYSADPWWYKLSVFAVSNLLNIPLIFSMPPPQELNRDLVAQQNRKDHLLMFRSKPATDVYRNDIDYNKSDAKKKGIG